MDLQALLAKRSTEVVNSSQTTRAAAVAGFEDVLSSAFTNTSETGTLSAMEKLVDNRSARRDARETADTSSNRTDETRRDAKEDVREDTTSEARGDEHSDRNDVREAKHDTASEPRHTDVNTTSQAQAADQTSVDAPAQTEATPAEQKLAAAADAAQSQDGTGLNLNPDATVIEVADATTVLAGGEQAATPAEIKLAAATDPNAQATQPMTAQQAKAAAQQAKNAQAPQQAQAANQQQQAQGTTTQQTTDGAAQTATQSQDKVDPLAKQQADNLAQRLDKTENVAVNVTKTVRPQQAAQSQAAQQTQQTAGSDKANSQALNPQQAVSNEGKAFGDSITQGQTQQNLTGGEALNKPSLGAQVNGVAAANKAANANTVKQAVNTQGGQASQATQATQASQAGASNGPAQVNAVSGTEGTSSTSNTSQPQVAALNQTQGAEKTQTTQAARAAVPKTPIPPKQVADQVKVNITRAATTGADTISIRLRPSELGRVEVKLETQTDGTVRAMVTADRPETLEVLRRDSAGLDKALQDAGLKTGQDSLNFSLRDQGGQGGTAQNENRNSNPYGSMAPDVDEMEALDENLAAYANSGSADGVDIRV